MKDNILGTVYSSTGKLSRRSHSYNSGLLGNSKGQLLLRNAVHSEPEYLKTDFASMIPLILLHVGELRIGCVPPLAPASTIENCKNYSHNLSHPFSSSSYGMANGG